MNKIATKIKDLYEFSGVAELYKCEPPLDGHSYVVVSATNVPYSGPETYIFPSNITGVVTHWGQLNGSFQGATDIALALARAGYTVAVVKAPTK